MTSTKSMRTASWLLTCFITMSVVATGCGPQLKQPVMLNAPYEDVQLWAVAPFINESGVSLVETDRVADMFVQQLQDVRGINALPVNRVIAAMRDLDMYEVRSPSDASALLSVLGADGLIVGTVTAYDQYRPMTFGAAIELHKQDRQDHRLGLDTRSLSRSTSEQFSPAQFDSLNPVAQAAGIFDARSHDTLSKLRQYTTGRNVPDSAFGANIYLVRMDLYMQFVSYRLFGDLLESEFMRLSPIVEESPKR